MSHMYTKSKINQIQNLMDARWKTEEKISQYRGLLKIFGRERKKEINEANKVRRQQALHIKELTRDCLYFRNSLGNSMYGNQQRVRNALQPDRTIQLTYQNLLPDRVLAFLEHANNKKQKELDILKYKKKKRMDIFTNLSLEKAELQDRLEVGFENTKFRRTIQIFTNRIEMFVVRQNAATQVCKLYKNMMNLLRNDAHYYDAILIVLYSVCDEQCRCVLQAVELGQLAAEDLNDIRDEYKWLEREVKLNMKDRDREVKHLRKVSDDLLLSCRLFTQAESYAYDYKSSETEPAAEASEDINNEVEELEEIMRTVQEATLSQTFFDIFPRMLDQLQQEETLMKQMKKMTECRDRVLHIKNHSEMLLASLTHTVSPSTVRFNEMKEKLESELEDESYRLNREREAIEDYGRILIKLKVSIMSLDETMLRLKELPVVEKEESSTDTDGEIAVDLSPEQVEESFLPCLEQNSKVLIQKISDGLALLHIYAYENLEGDTLEKARIMHKNDVLRTRNSSAPFVELDVPLLEEREVEDAGVFNRNQIKQQSKQLVDEHNRLVMMAEMGPAALAKMRRRM